MSGVALSDEALEKVHGGADYGGFTPQVTGVAFQYDGYWYKEITNGPSYISENCFWASRLDNNNIPTGVIIQIPSSYRPAST